MSQNRPGRNKGMKRHHLKAYSASVIKTGYRVDHGKVHELYKDKDLGADEPRVDAAIEVLWGKERKRMPIGKRAYDDPKLETERVLASWYEREEKVLYIRLSDKVLLPDAEYLFYNSEETQFMLVKRFKGVASRSIIYGNRERLLSLRAQKKVVWATVGTVRSYSSGSDEGTPTPS